MKKDIPLYGLYGEERQRSEPGPIHIERIIDRSKEHGWHIKPHRHTHLLQILHIDKGLKQASFDEQHFDKDTGSSFIIPPGMVHEFHFSPNSQGYVLSVSLEQLATLTRHDIQHFRHAQFCHCRWGCDASLKPRFDFLLNELARHGAGEPSSIDAQFLMVSLLLECIAQQARLQVGDSNSEQSLSQRFSSLVDQHYVEHLSVADYAERLSVSYPTLNRACLAELGTAPKTVISHRLLQEAKRKLLYTSMTIDQISHSLAFKDPGYFNRFFKKHCEQTPKAYRQRSPR